MAFTDDLNEKISNVGREMSQMVKDMSGKAKDLSDIAKLKMEVRNREAMLREQYMKLGKKYYNEYYKISDTNLYISGGIGNSVLNFRLFNRPSFNLYRLVDK